VSEPFERLTSSLIPLVADDIDTDRILPARFLQVTTKQGLGDNLFIDWRTDDRGVPRPEFPLNRPELRQARVLLTGSNFGCGSSREHAPWALAGWGIRVIIARSFADIFANNALKNGLLPIALEAEPHGLLERAATSAEPAVVTVDLEQQTVTLQGGTAVHFDIDAFARTCLLRGVDELGYLMQHQAAITAFEKSHEDASFNL
jgi:3-isopropylmalate/(R)-2-methylmalate dehydratase small subunit